MKFLIIGNQNAITYKEIFPLIKDGKIWLGCCHPKRFMSSAGPRSFGCIMWYTNLDHDKHHQDLLLYKHYDPDIYPRYDNYDAIEVSKTAEIPDDYDGIMGVPITFLDKYNPDQFEILGYTSGRKEFDPRSYPTKWYINPIQHNTDGTTANGSKVNTGAELIWRETDTGVYYTADNSEHKLKRVYNRILIRNKHLNTPKKEA